MAKSPDQIHKALMTLGETFYQRKMYREARIQWMKANAIKELGFNLEVSTRLAIAQSYLVEGNTDEAVQEYKTLLKDERATAEIKAGISTQIADAYLQSRQFGRAREQFNEIFESSKNQPVISSFIQGRIAQTYLFEKNYDKALEEYNKALNAEGAHPLIVSDAQKQIKLLTPLVQLEKEIQTTNKLPNASDSPSGACSDCE